MTALRALPPILAAFALAACAAEQAPAPSPEASSPDRSPGSVIVATSAPDGSIRVSGPAADEDALAAHHCFAAKRAKTVGAETLEWVGGIAKKRSDGVDADLAYETGAAPQPVSAAAKRAPAEGGAAPVESWMIYCDEAGIPREGRA